MSKSAVGQFSTSNVLLEDSQVQLSFPAATDKNGETVAYYAKIYWQPIYCSVSGANYISIETTDIVRVNTEIPLTVTGSTTLQSTITLNFDNKLSTDVRIYIEVIARDGINDHPDDPPVLTSGYYYVIRHQTPTLALSSAEWVPGAIREVQLNGTIVDYGFTTPGNLADLLATDLIWQAWRTGLETALGSINLTFNFKIAYSSDNINFSTPATYDITVIKELINATPGNAAYTNDLDFSFSFNKDATIPIPIESITQENSYFFKAYISSSHFTLGLDSNSTSILLTSSTPLFVMRNGIIQINLPKATTAETGAIMAARGPQQDVINGQSLALYDLHTESGQSEVANSPSIGFFDNLHNLMAKVGINYNISTDTGDIEITNFLTNGNIILTPNGTGVVKIGTTPLILIPSLTGNSGKFLTTNGTTVSWASVNAPHVGSAPPEDPPIGRLWLDTSVSPNLLKRWDGAAWVAAGAETLKTAGVDITAGSVQIDGAAVGFDMQNFSVNIKDPDDADISRVSMDGNGLFTGKINADALYTGPTYPNNAVPSFTGARASRLPPGTYTGWVNPDGSDSDAGIGGITWSGSKRTPQGMIDALPKFFDGAEVIVYLFPNTNFGAFTIDGFYGSGKLTVRTHTSDLNIKSRVPVITISRCSITIVVEEIATTAVGISNCKDVEINHCLVNNSAYGATGIDIQKSAVCVQSCEINVYHGIWLRVLSRALLVNNIGDCTYYSVARSGSEIRYVGTGAYSADNSFAEAANYFGSPVGTHGSGYVAPPTPTTQTAQFALVDSRSYRASPTNQWYANHTIGYGEYDPYGIWTGCMRFDLSALAGKTVVGARLRLYRRPNVGSSANETITVQTFTAPASLSGSAPTRSGAGASASIPRGVPTWMNINSADVQAVINGSAVGLCLYTGGTGYGKCDGLGDATPALLEVTYQ